MTMTEKAAYADACAIHARNQLADIGDTEKEIAALNTAIKSLIAKRDKLERRLKRQNAKFRKLNRSLQSIGEIDDTEILIENMTA